MDSILKELISLCDITQSQFLFLKQLKQCEQYIQSISTDFNQSTLQFIDKSNRSHLVTIKPTLDFPLSIPEITSEIGYCILNWIELETLINDIQSYIESYQFIWNELDLIDSCVQTLETRYQRMDLSRRINVGNGVVMTIKYNHINEPNQSVTNQSVTNRSVTNQSMTDISVTNKSIIETLPEFQFSGPPKYTLQHTKSSHQFTKTYNNNETILKNIENIFSIQLPIKQQQDPNEQQNQCGICYENTSKNSITCTKCRMEYHIDCLTRWISSAQSNVNLFTMKLRGLVELKCNREMCLL